MLPEIVLALLGVPVLAWATYLFVLVLLSGRRGAPAYGDPRLKLDVVVPAHDEEAGIADTVKSLLAADYPRELLRILVVADNCTDATAARAEAAGATVLVRNNADKRGKGYALEHAYARVLGDGFADAVVVVDADTSVSPNLFRAFAARFEAGAAAVQAEYGVRNPNASWRTRLMVIALAMFHALRSLARERMGVSNGLRGNGMGFSCATLAEVPHDAFSVVEDIEYGVRLGWANKRIWYVGEAYVLGEMVSSEKASRSQRERWERGRMQMAKSFGFPLVVAGLKKGSLLLFDLGMDLLIPPLTYIVGLTVLFAGVSLGLAIARGTWGGFVPWGICLFMLASYVLRGLVLSGTGMRGAFDLAFAPAYMAWKIALALKGPRSAPGEWVRTARENEKP